MPVGRITDPLRPLVAVAAFVAALLVNAEGEAQQVGRTPVEVRVPQPPTPAPSLGRLHLVYEIHLTNFGSSPLRLESLAVRDEDGRDIARLEGAPLARRVSVLGQPSGRTGSSPMLPVGARAVTYMWITLAPGVDAPDSLRHDLSFSGSDSLRDTLALSVIPVVSAKPAELDAPVRTGPWVAIRAPSNSSGHRLSLVVSNGRVRVPQRFAVDWAKLGDDGKLFRGDSTRTESWYGYRDTVYAAAAGKVVIARDGMPDNKPFAPPSTAVVDLRSAPGNVLVIDMGESRFASYAHLANGSLLVATGDEVAEGQAIGLIGNSGNSLGPHLHFQVSDVAEILSGEGLPFLVREFELVGRISTLGALLAGTPWSASDARRSRTVRSELPLENMVVRFGPR
jgi:murein DD-endopeptidase